MSGRTPSGETTLDSPAVASSAPLRIRRLHVVYSSGAVETPVVHLEREPVVLGRALASDDRELSRRHARLFYDAPSDRYVVEDLGSRNGVLVNGRRASHATLAPGDVIRVGRTLLVFVESDLPRGVGLAPADGRLLGDSLLMQRLRGDIARLAAQTLPVLVLGPTGSGKELVAEELHARSGRKGPLVAVNCAALPMALAESELFGHAAGAFTGAVKASEGLFQHARGGTLFLDEVGELSPPVQAKLLRALARGEVRPVGTSETSTVDVRIVAATHRDLATTSDARDGFREDLLARLAGWTLRVPGLAARREDVLLLAQVFLERAAPRKGFALEAAEALLVYGWPHNVRELELAVRAAAIAAAEQPMIGLAHLPAPVGLACGHVPLPAPLDAMRAELPLEALVPPDRVPDHGGLALAFERLGSVSRVAQYFGKDRKQIYRWAERLGVGSADEDDVASPE